MLLVNLNFAYQYLEKVIKTHRQQNNYPFVLRLHFQVDCRLQINPSWLNCCVYSLLNHHPNIFHKLSNLVMNEAIPETHQVLEIILLSYYSVIINYVQSIIQYGSIKLITFLIIILNISYGSALNTRRSTSPTNWSSKTCQF